MGLLFQMPVEENELDDRIINSENSIKIRSYGLPMIFWGYLLAIFAVLFFMVLAIKDPLLRAYQGPDEINRIIALVVGLIMLLAPILLLGAYFYEKEIELKKESLYLRHKVFFLPLRTYKVSLNKESFYLEHYLESLNVAAQEKREGMAGFENRGYYKLMVRDALNQRTYLVDRNSRRGEMRKLKTLLETFL
ncbi:MAG: hypothetical protein CME60_13205 [Halobacteriovoraceae bacterium]|nr:hypothetical protein [Halobacteriovoraceae bacterium]